MGLLGGLESGSESSNVEDAEQPHPSVPTTRPPRHTSSKYDFVKVRVWLGDNSDHYYVLSRFLVSRMLTVTKIPNHVAIKIALELKKLLIDNSLLDVSQSDLEGNLFKLMERRGYGDEYISRYKMMTRFHHQRVPLVIIVCGTACVGKSTIATQLAQRLNLPNVLQTDMVYELLRSAADLSDNAPLAHVPIWQRDFSSPEELITEFCRECRIVRKGLDGDLKKAMKDGKPVIIEGIHLDPAIYLMDEKTEVSISEKETQPTPLPDLVSLSVGGKEGVTEASKAPSPVRSEAATETVLGSRSERAAAKNEASSSGANKVASRAGSESSSQPGQPEESRPDQISQSESQSSGDRNAKGHLQVEKPPTRGLPKSIVVPIVLKMAEADHQALLDEWIASRSVGDSQPSQAEKEALTYKLQVIQDYLTAFEAQGMCVVDITVTTFPQTLDRLHSYLLECIERGCSTPSPRAGS